jgi:hypothetical protein
MIKRTMTMVAWAALSAAPAVVAAQSAAPAATVPLAALAAPGTCDCPVGDPRGELKNLAAFAPLGLLGALAAAGGVPSIFAARTDDQAPPPNVATNTTSNTDAARSATDAENAATERARNSSTTNNNPANSATDNPNAGVAPSLNRGRVPDPVSPDSLRAGLRAPNTGTPLPSVFLLGTGLIAIGCVTVLRTRS